MSLETYSKETIEIVSFNPKLRAMSTNALRLFDILEHIRRAMALNFPEALWIRAEIAQVRESRGHVFLELIEKEEGSEEWIAQVSAVIWAGNHRNLQKSLSRQYADVLQEGMEILCKARIDFHERYGLKLIIEDIDPAYTVGQLALERQKKYQTLLQENLAGKNAALPLPRVLQRIAVISSPQAAGWQDFEQQLQHNAFQYRFALTLFPAAMQGSQLEGEVLAQLSRIRTLCSAFDAVVIIRGGGSKLDLAGFDSLALCRAIAHFPLPVLTGIGHDIDETLADLMAHAPLKTPTAVAEYLIQHNLRFESQLLEAWQYLRQEALRQLYEQQLQMAHFGQLIRQLPLRATAEANARLQLLTQKIPLLTGRRLDHARQEIETFEKITRLLSVENTLKRGFSLTLLRGKPLQHPEEVQKGERISTLLAGGSLESEVL